MCMYVCMYIRIYIYIYIYTHMRPTASFALQRFGYRQLCYLQLAV